MSVSTEVQRTLVKSPPELWAELGSVEGLARHLGEVGEIRVVKAEPESRVEWEADLVSGVVELKQSGWGTKVTLLLTREVPAIEAGAESSNSELPEPAAETTAVAEPEPTSVETAPEPVAEPEPAASVPEPEPVPVPVPMATVTVEAKQGFFARLFKRRKTAGVQADPEPVVVTEPASEPAPPIELHAIAWPEPIYPEPPPELAEPDPDPDLAGELAELETQLQQESTELLTGVLDRLGAAHHRPFSRA